MKKPSILHRPMFNKGGSSAYGRGIASNLVSEEQRQRYNYGGRVGLESGTYIPIDVRTQLQEMGPLYTKDYFQNQYQNELNKLRNKISRYDESVQDQSMSGDPYQFSMYPYIGKKDWQISEQVSTPEGEEEYFEKEYYPGKKSKYAKKIADQQALLKSAGKDTSMFEDTVVKEGDTSLEELLADKTETKAPDAITGKNLPKDDESDILGLTPEERKALGSSMWFNMAAAGAGSKGKTVGEVLKDTLAGGAATTAKMVDPTTRMALRTKYEKAGEEARKTDKAEWDLKRKYGKSEEGQIDKVQELLKIPDRETAREVLYFGQGGIQKVSPKRQKDYEVYVANEEGYINSKGGAIFDEAIGEYVFYIDGKKYTTKDKSKAMKAKKKGLI